MSSPNDQPRACPSCRMVVDAATAVDGSGAVPSAGDVTVCAYCAAVLVFTEDGLRFPTEAELGALALDWRLAQAVAVATAFRRSWSRMN